MTENVMKENAFAKFISSFVKQLRRIKVRGGHERKQKYFNISFMFHKLGSSSHINVNI